MYCRRFEITNSKSGIEEASVDDNLPEDRSDGPHTQPNFQQIFRHWLPMVR